MAESPNHREHLDCTAVAEPPTPPGAPPATSAGASPAPKRRRWIAWTVGIVSVVIVVGALVGVVVWATGRGAQRDGLLGVPPRFRLGDDEGRD